MNCMLKKNLKKKEKFGILGLTILTIVIGYMGFSKKMLNQNDIDKDGKTIITTVNDSNYAVSKQKSYFSKSSKQSTYSSSSKKSNQNSIYDDTNAPAVEYTTSKILYVGESYDVMDNISASHRYFGDVTYLIDVIYNNVDNTTPGEYLVIYKACNYKGSIYCRTVNRKYTVKSRYETNSYTKLPKWGNNNSVSCSNGSSSCNTYNVSKPTATDPYSGKKLNVTLIDGNVDIYTAGTYVLVYQATTERGITSTTSKKVTITGNGSHYVYNNSNDYYDNSNYYNNSNNYSNSSDYYDNSNNYNNSNNYSSRPSSIYITDYQNSYYDDGIYSGYLNKNNSSNNYKIITNQEWKNTVSYTYRCDNINMSGTDGWSLVSTNTSNGVYASNADNHPTYAYNKNGYSGTLYKNNFYCLNGCTEKLIQELGTCYYQGQSKQINRTFVGIYSGVVYKTDSYNTYSGYVYLK